MLYASLERHNVLVTPFHIVGEGFQHTYCWFRGFFVVVCSRRDELLYIEGEVGLTVRRLRKRKRTGGVDIVLSSWQVVAVDIDEQMVRHSPVLDIHNGRKYLGDGVFLPF